MMTGATENFDDGHQKQKNRNAKIVMTIGNVKSDLMSTASVIFPPSPNRPSQF